jgi:hypothetical protein
VTTVTAAAWVVWTSEFFGRCLTCCAERPAKAGLLFLLRCRHFQMLELLSEQTMPKSTSLAGSELFVLAQSTP